AHTNLVFPVNSSCIMPCFKARVLSRFCSNAAISASMSRRMAAIACCSRKSGHDISMFSIVEAFKLGTPEASLYLSQVIILKGRKQISDEHSRRSQYKIKYQSSRKAYPYTGV